MCCRNQFIKRKYRKCIYIYSIFYKWCPNVVNNVFVCIEYLAHKPPYSYINEAIRHFLLVLYEAISWWKVRIYPDRVYKYECISEYQLTTDMYLKIYINIYVGVTALTPFWIINAHEWYTNYANRRRSRALAGASAVKSFNIHDRLPDLGDGVAFGGGCGTLLHKYIWTLNTHKQPGSLVLAQCYLSPMDVHVWLSRQTPIRSYQRLDKKNTALFHEPCARTTVAQNQTKCVEKRLVVRRGFIEVCSRPEIERPKTLSLPTNLSS